MSNIENYSNKHVPVLLAEIASFFSTDFLDKQENKNIFDGTFGGGGYSRKFLETGWNTYASDLDNSAIDRAKQDEILKQVNITQGNFSEVISDFEDKFFSGIVADLGFSTNQLEFSTKGFSYQQSEDLFDLRYDENSGEACWEKLYTLNSIDKLGKIIYTYSGEELSFKLANGIYNLVQNYKQNNPGSLRPISVGEIVNVIENSIPVKFQKKKNSILSRFWQSMRIWTNAEFENLEIFLQVSIDKLSIRGRLAIVSFHSLEDKIVTKFMRRLAKPIEIDDFGNTKQKFKLLTPKAILPTQEEVDNNPKSRSAMLRVLERLE